MSNLARIQKVSLILYRLCTVTVLLIPIVLAALWATYEHWAPTHPEITRITTAPETLTPTTRSLAFLVAMLQAGIAMFAVWRLRALFGLYAVGRIFTPENTRCLRHFATAVLVFALAKPVTGGLLSVVLTINNAPGQRQLAVSFGSSELTTLFIGCVFLVIAWIMDEARELAEDQAEIV